ncbi:MAG TPA: transposase [Terriglobales bacterium]
MPRRLRRKNNTGHLHFIASTCFHRIALLNSARKRDLFLHILDQVRQRYNFIVVGYVVMPEHIHLLISEPERGNISTVMQVIKQRFARRLLREWRARSSQLSIWEPLDAGHVWQRRFYDFVVLTEQKKIEKLRYIHRNPVRSRLVLEPGQWKWSSFRDYALGIAGPVYIDRESRSEMKAFLGS